MKNNVSDAWYNKLSDPYLYAVHDHLRFLSVFDSLKYDRSDADYLSPAMRQHVTHRLTELGFKQVSGTKLHHTEFNCYCIMPKSHALGASPFDITRYTKSTEEDFVIVTPTQLACQFIDAYDLEEALEKIKALIVHQPINVFRIKDYLEDKPRHHAFLPAVPHLKYLQRQAVEAEPLKNRRGLKLYWS